MGIALVMTQAHADSPRESTKHIAHDRATSSTNPMEQRANFQIPPQALGKAIVAFGEQVNLVIVGRSANLEKHQSQAISGNYVVRDALTHMLEGSGLHYEFLSPNGIILSKPPSTPPHEKAVKPIADSKNSRELEEIIITGHQPDTSFQNAPIAVTSISQHRLSEYGVADLSELTDFVPSIVVT
ncbi:MAG: iron complex outermembrane receptor protein [Flavobacteriales bacterium]|jgi:iron complex outermembrane receptor protein